MTLLPLHLVVNWPFFTILLRYALHCLWNQLPLSHSRQPHSGASSSISYSPIPSPITSSSSLLCTSITASLFHPRLKTYTSFTNPTSVVSLLPPGLPPRTFAWTVSPELLGFCFYFSLFFSFLGRALN